MKKNEMIKEFKSVASVSKGHNKIAYNFAIDLLNNMRDDVDYNVRKNANETAYNIGDIAECMVKDILSNMSDSTYSYSFAGESDINRKRKNEIKTFSNSNRYPNGFESPQGFIAVSRYGVHYITKKMVVKNWETMRDYKGVQKQPTLNWLKSVIDNENPKLLKGLTNGLGL